MMTGTKLLSNRPETVTLSLDSRANILLPFQSFLSPFLAHTPPPDNIYTVLGSCQLFHACYLTWSYKQLPEVCRSVVCIFLILQMQKRSIRPELNPPAWGINSMVKSGPKFQSSDSRLRAHSTSPISHAPEFHCLAHILVLNYSVILEVTAFIGTQSNLRRAKVLLGLVLLITHSFSESKRSPENGTSVMCCKGHRNN